MKKLLLIIIILLSGCKEKTVKEKDFNYINFTHPDSAIIKLADIRNYNVNFTSIIDGETTIYDFNKEQEPLLNKIKNGEIIFFINTTEHENKASITFSIKPEKRVAYGKSIFTLPIRGNLISNEQSFNHELKAKFTFEENGNSSTLDFIATKKN